MRSKAMTVRDYAEVPGWACNPEYGSLRASLVTESYWNGFSDATVCSIVVNVVLFIAWLVLGTGLA